MMNIQLKGIYPKNHIISRLPLGKGESSRFIGREGVITPLFPKFRFLLPFNQRGDTASAGRGSLLSNHYLTTQNIAIPCFLITCHYLSNGVGTLFFKSYKIK